MITFVLATIMLCGMGWEDPENRYVVPIAADGHGGPNSDAVILALTNSEHAAVADNSSPVDELDTQPSHTEICLVENTTALSVAEFQWGGRSLFPFAISPRTAHHMLDTTPLTLASVDPGGVNVASYTRRKITPQFAALYRAVLKRAAMMSIPHIQNPRTTIVGAVSTYNPFRDGTEEGGAQTASGEPYDPDAWTAAIKINLRDQFGGVRYGRLYQPTFALVESGDKQVIVKINDVGPLKPGRVLDLNERSMRHFDPFLTRGLIENVSITLLPGENWTPGPVGKIYAVDFVTPRAGPALLGSIDSARWQIDPELVRLPGPIGPVSHPLGIEDVRAEIRPSEGG
ncbi:MAG TPA: septal ring lytic transglycosylase RlpA family protein [Pseudolabrys sp.]|nr:septal ring lytic transglycosylase RlpA family protein [Pseudolabrys sp.]